MTSTSSSINELGQRHSAVGGEFNRHRGIVDRIREGEKRERVETFLDLVGVLALYTIYE